MQVKFLFPIIVVLCLFSCSKDSNSVSADSGGSIGTGGSLARFTIVDNYLYIANNNSIEVMDISNTASPVAKGEVAVNANVETIFSYDDQLFIGTTTGIFIYSLQNPMLPSLTGQAQHLRSCDPVIASDTFAYSTLQGNSCGPATSGLYTYYIKDIKEPVLMSVLELPTPKGLGINGKTVYVCQQENGMSIVDVTDPKKPVLVSTIANADFRDVIVYDDMLICYVSTGLKLYDVSDAQKPVFLTAVDN